MRPRLRVADRGMPQCCTAAAKALSQRRLSWPTGAPKLRPARLAGGRDRGARRVPLDEPQPVLELGDAQLELLVLGSRDEAELAEHALERLPRPLAEPRRVAAPAQHRVLDHLLRLVFAEP